MWYLLVIVGVISNIITFYYFFNPFIVNSNIHLQEHHQQQDEHEEEQEDENEIEENEEEDENEEEQEDNNEEENENENEQEERELLKKKLINNKIARLLKNKNINTEELMDDNVEVIYKIIRALRKKMKNRDDEYCIRVNKLIKKIRRLWVIKLKSTKDEDKKKRKLLNNKVNTELDFELIN